MATQAIEPAPIVPAKEPAPAAKPPSTLADQVPWAVDGRDTPMPGLRAGRSPRGEAVHWSVVALTVLTAAAIVFGAHRPPMPQPADPVLIISEAP